MACNFVPHLLALFLLSTFSYGSSVTEISYVERDVLTGTNSDDVKGLDALQSKFAILTIWTGDPCTGLLPWSWIQCTTDATPRVTALNLANFALVGTLPDFGSMDALETIDLSNNYLSGPIPDFLGTLPDLQELNLENNNFQGTIPTSLSSNKKLTLMVSGNTNLCTSDKSCKKSDTTNSPDYTTPVTSYSPDYTSYDTKKKKRKLPIILGILIPIFVLFWVVVGFIAIMHHKRKSAAVAAAVAAGNLEMKPQEGENTATRMDQEGNTYANENEHAQYQQQQQHSNV